MDTIRTEPRNGLPSLILPRRRAEEHHYSWLESYMEWLEGKEARSQYSEIALDIEAIHPYHHRCDRADV